MIVSDPQHDLVMHNPGLEFDETTIDGCLREMDADITPSLRRDGYTQDQVVLQRLVDLRYRGQKGTLRIPVSLASTRGLQLESVLDDFEQEHLRTYGHSRSRSSIELVSVCLSAICQRRRVDPLSAALSDLRGERGADNRRAYFGGDLGFVPTPVITRSDLASTDTFGQLIIEEPDATTVVPPWAKPLRDEFGNVVMMVSGSGQT
jgi:N-methylhydantoinase A